MVCLRSFVGKMLDKDADDAETWVVDLIRAGQLKARIDSTANTVIVEPPKSRLYARTSSTSLVHLHEMPVARRHQAVAEKTRSTLSRASFVWNRLAFTSGPSKK